MRASQAKSLSTLRSLIRLAGNTSSFKYSLPTKAFSENYNSRPYSDHALSSLKFKQASDSEDLPSMLSKRIHSILDSGQSDNGPEPQDVDDAKDLEKLSDISCLNMSHSDITLKRKEFSREKKRNCMFEFRQSKRFGKLLISCADKLGTKAVAQLFHKLGRELGVQDYNALIRICIDKARETEDKEVAVEEMAKVFHLFKSMREQGFQLEEKTYRPLVLHIIDRGMVEEFQFFINFIKDNNLSSISRLGYYEMMLWLRVNNEEKIQDFCDYIANNDGADTSDLRENYLLALCESDRKKDILQVLEIVDIKKLSSVESKAKIFQSLGRLLLEPVAVKFLSHFKICDHEADNITNFIASYAVSMPNLAVEDVISKFKEFHQTLEVPPSSSSYEKLILHTCDLLKKNILDGLRALEHMRGANVRPDLQTLSYLISNSETKEDIDKYYAELTQSGFQATKQIFTTLIMAYAACGELDKVILDPFIPVSILNEIKAVLVSTLASHGQLSEALLIYEEIKQAGQTLEPKTLISLIEHTQSDGELNRLLLLLEELHDPDYWIDGCCRIVLYCIWNKHISSAVDLCKRLKDKYPSDERVMEVLFKKVFSFIEESGSTHLQTVVELFREMEDKLGLLPPKQYHDYLIADGKKKKKRLSNCLCERYKFA